MSKRLDGRSPESGAETDFIKAALNQNPLFKYLDNEQKSMLASFARLVPFTAQKEIVREGDIGDTFYIVHKGSVNVTQATADGHQVVGTIAPGGSFGEKGMFYDTRRSGGAKAAEDAWVWTVDRRTFHQTLTSSKSKQDFFQKYAQSTDASGAKVMRPVDFMRSMIPNEDFTGMDEEEVVAKISKAQPRLALLLDLVDRNRSGNVDLLEYCLFDVIARKPDPFLDFAFLMFDEDKKGYVNIKDVERVMSQKGKDTGNAPFDIKSSRLMNFFAGEGRLRYLAFAEFYLTLQEELPREEFQRFDTEKTGRIGKNDFIQLMNKFGHWRMPTTLKQRVHDVGGLSSGREVVSYSEFMAFNNLLNHLPGVMAILRHAKSTNGGKAVSKTDFIKSATIMHSVRPSPLEVDIIYSLTETSVDGGITLEAFEQLTGVASTSMRSAAPIVDEKTGQARSVEAAINFAMGSVAGAIGAIFVYPIDFIKTRLQNQPYDAAGKGTLYSGIFDCAKKTIQHEGGPTSLYRGLPSQLVGVAPEKAIKLATNDLLRSLFAKDDQPLDLPLEILAGACAGGMQVIFTNPYELVKIRMQIQGAEAATNPAFVPKSLGTVVREMGFGGMYKGASACLARDVPFSAIYFPTYAHVKSGLMEGKESLSKVDLLLAGAIAGAPAAYLVTPSDVIKTRLQADAKGQAPRFKGLADCFFKTWRAEGIGTFFVGGGMRVFRSSPQFAITLLVYEVLQKNFAPKAENPRPLVLPAVSKSEYRDFSTPLLNRIFPGL